jgi:uncharacterized RDD family membrane protein YckC
LNDIPAPAATAHLARRLGSMCYEILLLAAILFAAGWIFLAIERLLPAALARALFQLYLLVVCGVYFVYCWSHSGQTLPMKTWRIRVMTREGGMLSTRRATLRYLLALAGIALAGVGFWWALFDRDGQFLHDRLAGTRIISEERRQAPRGT